MFLLKLKSHDPYTNLAIERFLLEKLQNVLILWRNNPCVVIGRNQNPWAECNLVEMTKDKVLLCRRYSGGGAVYHDLGNSLYSIIQPKNDFCREKTALRIQNALKSIGINLQITKRHDLTFNGFKVSGSAFRITAKSACHHGTMLLNTDLNRLKKYLYVSTTIKSNAVSSIPSPVCNLNISHDEFCNAMINEFDAEETTLDFDFDQFKRELMSSEWLLGQTPKFIENGIEVVSGKVNGEWYKLL